MSEYNDLAANKAASLRALASLIESNPELAPDVNVPYVLAMKYQRGITDQRAWLTEWKTAAFGQGLTFEKAFEGADFEGHIDLGAFKVRVVADRDQVCERIVTGTKTVTKTVKDPDALAAVPEVEVTEEVEIVEWQCKPLLAAESGGVS